ncbi:hypothetical protein FSW04_00980 [Baekduia soli]|uniref:Blue (type 1) copper domain-containing protein n=1 Tax=Baekduia soli TaxID=496014 RepID=A0A5B8TZX6_9ACTN|nr:plastocyanin/azurin family copper-binding protein [Baekduia soli]QEC46289.1 hypothetical protein FSW04_00980 [Baekduia soli]
MPAASQAATKIVTAGPPLAKPPAGVPQDADVDSFFPGSVKIHVGDTVKFERFGFHNIGFPKRGAKPAPLAMLDPTHPAAGVVDSLGAPFWFNGLPTPIIPSIVSIGTKSGKPYTGAAAIGSGLPTGPGKPKPWLVKFPKAGTYTFYCSVHFGMKGTVTVVGKRKPVPSAKSDAARVKKQLAAAIAGVKKLDKAAGPASPNTVTTGPDTTKGPVLLRFTPGNLTTTVGTPVTFEMTPGTPEDHTFTFAKDTKALAKDADATFVAPLPGGPPGPPTLAISPKYAYPSEAGGTVTYDGNNHGDGFLNSGVLDGISSTPFPDKFTVTFTAPGTYSYICSIHTFMHGTVTVQ